MDQYWIKTDKLNKFKRPENAEDIRYRKMKKMYFADELQKVLPSDCHLCFHGTTIWNTEIILESGEISSRMDREGYDEDFVNRPGMVSVTTINNVWFTIKNFADLNNYKYPAGSIFVIKVDADEYDSAVAKNEIKNIDLKNNPNSLECIITTPENVDRIKDWLHNSSIQCSPDIVVDYDESLEFLKRNQESELQK